MIAGSGWAVGVKWLDQDKWQVFWYDDPSLKTGPYERPELVYTTEGSAGAVATRLAEMFGNGSLRPSDAGSVVKAAADP